MRAKERIIQDVARELKATSYLEIGAASGFCLSHIDLVVENCYGVEPNEGLIKRLPDSLRPKVFHGESNDYFENLNQKMKFDLIFIDGLHHAEQVEQDIVNAWYHLKKDGMILLHDIHPPTEEHQRIPRMQDSWTGDVWKAFVGFREKYPKVPSGAIHEKYGLGWIRKIPRTKLEVGFSVDEGFDKFSPERLGYKNFADI